MTTSWVATSKGKGFHVCHFLRRYELARVITEKSMKVNKEKKNGQRLSWDIARSNGFKKDKYAIEEPLS